MLSVIDTSSGEVVVLGEIAHIVAEQPTGPRGDASVPALDRNSYPNLLLLCQEHHQLIDAQEAAYGVERLRAMKEAHESWVAERLGTGVADLQVQAPDVKDILYSTVLPVVQLPKLIRSARTSARYPSEIESKPRAGCATPFVLHDGRLWAFQDLAESDGPESPWVTWRLRTLETRMESCQQNGHQVGRRRVGIRIRRRCRRCGWCVSSAPRSGRSTGR
jgi:hypothetical protein